MKAAIIAAALALASLSAIAEPLKAYPDSTPAAIVVQLDGVSRRMYLLPITDGCPHGWRAIIVNENGVTLKAGCYDRIGTQVYVNWGLGASSVFPAAEIYYYSK